MKKEINNDLGWIKLHRSLLYSKVFTHPDVLKIWMWCLLKAKHAEKKEFAVFKTGKGETIVEYNRGEFVTGRTKAGIELRMNGKKVYYWLKKFASAEFDHMVCTTNKNHYTVIKINNWETYQLPNNGTMGKEWASNGQAMGTNKNDNNDNNTL